MANSSLSISCVAQASVKRVRAQLSPSSTPKEDSLKPQQHQVRRWVLLGMGAATAGMVQVRPLQAEAPSNYKEFVDREDGYSYFYPADWREFDFRAHDSAFKDRYRQLQNVRVRFIPTAKENIHEMGTLEEVANHLATRVYAAPNQRATIMSTEEKTEGGKSYYTFEYQLTSPNYSSVSFATVAVGNGRYYTLIVGANERRWRRFRGELKVVADSFRILDM